MNNLAVFPLYFILFYLIGFILKKTNFLVDKTNFSKHKKFISKKEVPISGGILFYTLILLFFESFNFTDKIYLFLILLVGLLSDINILRSALKRLILQSLIIISYVYVQEIHVLETRIEFFDELLESNHYISLIFSSFCIITLVNGTNFIDGTNALASGYILIVLVGLTLFLINFESPYEDKNIQTLIYFLIVFLIFNFFSFSYLGDGGSYLISFILGIICLEFSNIFVYLMSPYFIVLLLWYPALENLFTIIRRGIMEKKNVNSADNLHLHHLIFKFLNKLIKKDQTSSTLTGVLINFVILIFILFGIYFANDTKMLLLLIFLKTMIYFYSYISLKKFN